MSNTKDEYGFDRSEDYVTTDNPFWDTTDAAHPAWWRGNDYATEQICVQLETLLNIPPTGSLSVRWQLIRREISALMECKKDFESAVIKLKNLNDLAGL